MADARQASSASREGGKFLRPLVTPEGIDLGVRIASASERAGAFLIDSLIIFAALVGLSIIIWIVVGDHWRSGNFGGAELAVVVWLLGSFLLRNFYFFLFEVGARAATPGKRILKIRVAARNGGVLDAGAVFARNAMRELEVFLPMSFLFSNAESVDGIIGWAGLIWCGVFVLFPLFNRDRLRAGDLVAGTWVVQAPRTALLPDLAQPTAAERVLGKGMAGASAFAFTREQLDVYGIRELQVLEDVLRQPVAQSQKVVAQRIRAKIGWTATPNEQDVDFLSAYYAALRQHLEAGLLVGVRRADKHAKR